MDVCLSTAIQFSVETNQPDYPSYELFTETLREGVFRPSPGKPSPSDWQGRQLRLVVDKTRKVQDVIKI